MRVSGLLNSATHSSSFLLAGAESPLLSSPGADQRPERRWMSPARERSVPIRFLKRAAMVLCLWSSASCLAQEVAHAPFEVVPSLLDKAKESIGVPYRFGGGSPSGSRGDPGRRGVKFARLDSSFQSRRLVSARRVMTARDGTDGTPETAPVQAVPEADSPLDAGRFE